VPLNATQRAAMQGPYAYFGANGLVDHVNDYLFEGDYVLLAEDGGYFDDPVRGVAYEASGKFWVNNHAHILGPLGGISAKFLRQLLNAIDWMPYVGGTTRLKLTQGGLQQAIVRKRREASTVVVLADSSEWGG
jgi:type I restriction enzyme S subunit